jgi:hypothetical protein
MKMGKEPGLSICHVNMVDRQGVEVGDQIRLRILDLLHLQHPPILNRFGNVVGLHLATAG